MDWVGCGVWGDPWWVAGVFETVWKWACVANTPCHSVVWDGGVDVYALEPVVCGCTFCFVECGKKGFAV